MNAITSSVVAGRKRNVDVLPHTSSEEEAKGEEGDGVRELDDAREVLVEDLERKNTETSGGGFDETEFQTEVP